jgi:hypothetical protein
VRPRCTRTARWSATTVNIHDVVDANLLVLEAPGQWGEPSTSGAEPLTPQWQFAEVVQAHYGSGPSGRVTGQYRFGDTRHIFSDVSELEGLGWSRTTDAGESVAEYADWLEGMPGLGQPCSPTRTPRCGPSAWSGGRRMKAFLLAAGLGTRLRP